MINEVLVIQVRLYWWRVSECKSLNKYNSLYQQQFSSEMLILDICLEICDVERVNRLKLRRCWWHELIAAISSMSNNSGTFSFRQLTALLPHRPHRPLLAVLLSINNAFMSSAFSKTSIREANVKRAAVSSFCKNCSSGNLLMKYESYRPPLYRHYRTQRCRPFLLMLQVQLVTSFAKRFWQAPWPC